MSDISDLEAEYELETDDEFEQGDDEQSDDHEFEADEEIDTEPAEEIDAGQTYSERFQELATREFETEEEFETGLRDILGEMEQQYFLGGLVKKGLGFAKKMAKKAAAKGLKYAAGRLPISKLLKGATGLLGKNLTDQLLRMAQSVVPGGAIGIPALQALGIIPGGAGGEAPAGDSETWERFSEFAQEVYETAADRADETSLHPLIAMQQAKSAITDAARTVSGVASRPSRHGGAVRSHHGRRVVHVRPGESITIVCK